MCCKIGLLLYTLIQCAAFVLILVGTPLGQFRAKSNEDLWGGNKYCVTLWGSKMKCQESKYLYRVKDLFSLCTDRRDRFQAAEAMAIVSIIIFGVAFLLGAFMFCCCPCFKWLCIILNVVGFVTACIVWACMADAFNQGRGPEVLGINACPPMKDQSLRYGEGFVLILVAWLLDIIAIPFLFLPC